MGLFGKGVTWSASHSMGESQGESQLLLPNNTKRLTQEMRIMQYFNPIVILTVIKARWQKEETQDTQKIKT
uniref:S2 protein n=1 Tax=Equine infectious anemia virus TaxID=11665 RepID=D0UGW7_9RETR|nr:S2 protein [Equine infectious anemia virus]ACY07739.1 S2 protein [Equine infectious anemia virus]ACY07741.1 S2 protein [Equine infectious anemia virus]ACY07744.1 S2 protein [Equine infectious anemia virus]ACY07746.1 S2 protein [Equine infectious anemia virus]